MWLPPRREKRKGGNDPALRLNVTETYRPFLTPPSDG